MTRIFAQPGPTNTEETLTLARQKALELKIDRIVLATRLGDTALKAAEVFKGTPTKIIAVCHQYGYVKAGEILVTPQVQKELKEKGVHLTTSTMVLTTTGRLFRREWKRGNYLTTFPFDVIADTLRMFCQGMKVCVEIVAMAADTGAIPINQEVISIAGTHRGADTAIVLMPAHTANLFDTRIHEIIAKPRTNR
jgi:hypothetical protein